MKGQERRKEILRQLARSADGLRINEVRGMSSTSAGEYMAELRKAELVEMRPYKAKSTSSRPICRYVISDKGRELL